jgi:hypothetical protein
MKFQDFFDSNAGFRSIDDIKSTIKKSKDYNGEDPTSANTLKFFSTLKQRTYLVATAHRLYCILDDIRKKSPHINWSLPKSDIKDYNGVKLIITSRNKTDKTGLIDIGEKHKRWLYTKKLFSSKDIETSIMEFLNNAM